QRERGHRSGDSAADDGGCPDCVHAAAPFPVLDGMSAGHRMVRAGSSTLGWPPVLCARRTSWRYSREHMAVSIAIPARCTRTSLSVDTPVSRTRRVQAAFAGTSVLSAAADASLT